MMPRRVKNERSLAPQMAWSASRRASESGMGSKIDGQTVGRSGGQTVRGK
jgi:hypothetical protein